MIPDQRTTTVNLPNRLARRSAARAATLLALAACAAPSANGGAAAPSDSAVQAPVTVTVDRATYAAGAEVTLRIENRSDERFGYNACTRTVEREAGAGWISIPEPDRVCTMEIRFLDPRSSVTERTELPRALERGRYRLLLSLLRNPDAPAEPGRQPERVLAPSNTFRVE